MILRAAAFVVTLTVVASAARAACGDGFVDPGEQCDEGAANGSSNACCTGLCQLNGNFPDVIVGDIDATRRWGNSGGITAYSIATTSCNVGSCWLKFIANNTDHPVIAQNMFRLKDGRFEQIGQSWLKHGLGADSGNVCSNACIPVSTFDHLGVNCSDPYDAQLNGTQSFLGPKYQVNASTGVFPYPFTPGSSTGVIAKRLQVHDVDLDPVLNSGALYFVESQYVARDDATAHADSNNASYRRVSVGTAPNYALTVQDTIHRQQPAIQAWRGNDPGVIDSTFTGADGIFFLSAKVTPLGGGIHHYEYAVQNLNSDRSGQSFSVSIPPGAVVTNIGFHDVDYHSGEPFAGTDWVATVSPTAVTWATQTYAENQNANALRWGTLYDFRFDVNAPPGVRPIVLGLFKPGAGSSLATSAMSPIACAGLEASCGNGFDEDCDGQTDCADTDCCEQCAGQILLSRSSFSCVDTLDIALDDSDLDGAGSLAVSVGSTSEPDTETLFLAESPAGSGHFSGALLVTDAPAASGDGAISVADGDTINVGYLDVFRCGSQDVPLERSAQVDCHGPAITNVRVTDVQSTSAEIRWETEEPADSGVVYGPTVPPNLVSGPDADLVTSHVVRLEGLPACTAHSFSVGSSDGLGNQSIDDNGGSFFDFATVFESTPSFTSPDPPIAIPVGPSHGARAKIVVPDVDVVMDVNVKVNVLHPADEDLVLYLIGPDNTTVVLSIRNGTGADYGDTIFDDEASRDLTEGASPFFGLFRPDEPLSAFDGKIAAGTWTLRVSDDGGFLGAGTLEGFELELAYSPRVCGPSVGLDSRTVSDACTGVGAGGGNGTVEPGETVQLVLHAVNQDTRSATGVSAHLSSFTPGAVVTSASSTYPDLAPGASAPGDAPYILDVSPGVLCGTSIVLRLDGTCNEGGWSTAFEVRVGEPVSVTSTYVNNVSKPIPDLSTARSFMSVTDAGIVQDVDVGLSISHSTPPDLDIFLVGPDDTRVELSTDNGGFAAGNYTGTVFDDEAATPITAGSAPFTGSFRPESPLSLIDGAPAYGTWTLEMTDDHAPFPGTLLGWSLTMQRLAGYSCETCVVALPPPEVISLAWSGSGKDTLGWSETPRATTYRLHRGGASDLPALLDTGVDSCDRGASSLLSSGPILTEGPAVGTFYWYLVGGENAYGAGPMGNATSGARGVDSNGACP